MLSVLSIAGEMESDEQIPVSFWLVSSKLGLLEEADRIASLPIRSRVYLSREQLKATYGPPDEAIETVHAFAQKHGLEWIGGDAGGTLVHLMVSKSKVKHLFGVDLSPSHPEGSQPLPAPHNAICLPREDFSARQLSMIRGIFGLDRGRQTSPSQVSHSHASGPSSFQFPHPTPDEFKGDGQCVGILQFGGLFEDRDLNAVIRNNTAAANVSVVIPIRFKPTPYAAFYSETSLDVQIVARTVPNAKQVLYLLPNSEQGWIAGMQRALFDAENAPSVLSISAGWPEMGGSPGQSYWSPAAFDALEDMFARATLIGMTVCCASGDSGPAVDNGPHVFYPASSRYVLACGGTQNNGTEVVWSDRLGASGGGISDVFPIPSWQRCVQANVLASDGLRRPAGALEGRLVPDVAAPAHAFIQGYGAVTGTSAAAPLWAGLIALANQQLQAKSINKTVGNLTAILYDQSSGLQGACNDITTGNNAVPRGNLAYYSAGLGWDACTGWGTPTGQPFIEKLLENAAEQPSLSNYDRVPSA
jgi:kumamolisin